MWDHLGHSRLEKVSHGSKDSGDGLGSSRREEVDQHHLLCGAEGTGTGKECDGVAEGKDAGVDPASCPGNGGYA